VGVGGFVLDLLYFCCFQCVPQHVPNSTSLYPISITLSTSLVTYIISPKEADYHKYILRQLKASYLFSNWPINDAYHTSEKIELWGFPTTG